MPRALASHMSHARWWADTERDLDLAALEQADGLDHCLFPILAFEDASFFDKFGDQQGEPILLAPGNCSIEVLKQNRSKDVCGYIPQLQAVRSEGSTDDAAAARKKLLHDCIAIVFGGLTVRR
jgi:hypothetical protein